MGERQRESSGVMDRKRDGVGKAADKGRNVQIKREKGRKKHDE